MTDIIICGIDNEILDTIKRCLEKYYDKLPTHENTLISSLSYFPHELNNNSIVVFSNNFHRAICVGKFTAIFFASNHHAVEALNGSGNIAISCGTSPKDTISAASMDGDKRLVSLQRTLKTFNGKVIEPCDFYVKSKCRLYTALAACAVMLILGITPENGFEF